MILIGFSGFLRYDELRRLKCFNLKIFVLLATAARHILDRVCFGLRLIQAPAVYHSGSGTCRAKSFSCLAWTSHPIFTSGSSRPIFYNGG